MKEYEKDLAQFGRDVREEFESMWVFEEEDYYSVSPKEEQDR
jgi:hypothetical protein